MEATIATANQAVNGIVTDIKVYHIIANMHVYKL